VLTLTLVLGASGIAYASLVALIFTFRYLNVLRWGLKLTWMALGVTVAAEVAGKVVLNNGFATQLRPRKYYTIPRETLDAAIGDVHELINFFVIEAQRVLFAENVYVTAAVSGPTIVPALAPELLEPLRQSWKLMHVRPLSLPSSHIISSRSSPTGAWP
jgi:hypothetical protein